MMPLTLFLLGCVILYVGVVQAAFSALMRLPLRLNAERSEWNGGERYGSSSSALPEGQHDPQYYNTAQGRARSNTYRSSTHDGRAVGGAALSSSAIQACSAEDGRSGAERETLCQEDPDLVASDANGAHRPPSGPKAASPTLPSLSPDHAAAKRDPSPDDVARHTGSKLTQD